MERLVAPIHPGWNPVDPSVKGDQLSMSEGWKIQNDMDQG